MALLHSFGQRLRCATKSLISKSFTGEVSHEARLWLLHRFGRWVRCATRQCCGEMFTLTLPRETLIVRENFEHLGGVLQILETDFSQRYSLLTAKPRSDETCDQMVLVVRRDLRLDETVHPQLESSTPGCDGIWVILFYALRSSVPDIRSRPKRVISWVNCAIILIELITEPQIQSRSIECTLHCLRAGGCIGINQPPANISQ